MEDLIPLINKLQSVFKKTGAEEIKLPQIVVVGSQSSGKSSVLESLVKKSILPRGSGIVTRCPMILQLNQVRPGTRRNNVPKDAVEWCFFSKHPDVVYTDFDKVRRAIEDTQTEMAGSNKGISMVPIILEVYSPNIIDLTVVDLPGIVKNPVGDQPLDIEDQVNNLILKYIKNESAIILAVSAANVDIATSESIKMAKEVDRTGDRTIAVITKLDLMDEGTDATNVINGDVIKVKLGIVGVVNRSQKDIDKNTTVEDAIKKEEKFLQQNYPHVHGMGSRYLAMRLNQLLKEHIHKNLPALINRISKMSTKCERELNDLGKEISTDPHECSWIIMDTTLKFAARFKEVINGRALDLDNLDDPDPIGYGLYGDVDKPDDLFAVSVNKIFEELKEGIVLDEDNFEPLRITRALKKTLNFEGYCSIEEVFKTMVKEGIRSMEGSTITCAKEVHDLLSGTAAKCFQDTRLKYLNNMLKSVLDELLGYQLARVESGVREHIKLSMGMIHSSDKDFLKLLEHEPEKQNDDEIPIPSNTNNGRSVPLGRSIPKGQGGAGIAFPLSTCKISQISNGRISHVRELILKYLEVSKRELCDYIPKYLIFHLAQETIEKIPEAVKKRTLGKETALVSEPEEIKMRRKHLQELLKNVREAAKIIRDIKMGW